MAANWRMEQALQAVTEKDRHTWQHDSEYMQLIRDRILKAAKIKHESYLMAFLAEKDQ